MVSSARGLSGGNGVVRVSHAAENSLARNSGTDRHRAESRLALSITGAEGFDGLEVRIDEPDADSVVWRLAPAGRWLKRSPDNFRAKAKPLLTVGYLEVNLLVQSQGRRQEQLCAGLRQIREPRQMPINLYLCGGADLKPVRPLPVAVLRR